MPSGTNRIAELDPNSYLASITKRVTTFSSEVELRRTISAIYFCLFNYWAAKAYARGERGPQEEDGFSFSKFSSVLAQNNLGRELITIHSFRTAVDHHILNPANFPIGDQTVRKLLGSGTRQNISIDTAALNRILSSANAILTFLNAI
ncbi:MAG: hypothetical protein KIY11_05865 [Thermoplasmata archaeon]|nr:hypothetical protein [Candidatus Sysuiplasma acidicola]